VSSTEVVRKSQIVFREVNGHRVDGVDRLVEVRDGFEIVALVD
jgi:hypothetical protein